LSALLGLLVAARTRKFQAAEGVEIVYTLPSKFRCSRLVDAMRSGDGDEIIDLLLPILKDWSGITEAMLLGPSRGASSPAVFEPEVARIALGDRPGWVTELVMHALKEAGDESKRLGDQSGN
jgi:hypothetical protein